MTQKKCLLMSVSACSVLFGWVWDVSGRQPLSTGAECRVWGQQVVHWALFLQARSSHLGFWSQWTKEALKWYDYTDKLVIAALETQLKAWCRAFPQCLLHQTKHHWLVANQLWRSVRYNLRTSISLFSCSLLVFLLRYEPGLCVQPFKEVSEGFTIPALWNNKWKR